MLLFDQDQGQQAQAQEILHFPKDVHLLQNQRYHRFVKVRFHLLNL